MIKLYQFGPNFGLPDASPFCLKVDLYLRACEIEFEPVADIGNLRKAPKAKLPFIEDDGTTVCDSDFIIDYLKKNYGDRLDKELTAEQRAITRAFSKMLDENLYWCLVYSRWVDAKGWEILKDNLFNDLSFPLRLFLPVMVRKNIIKAMDGHGIGRHSHEEKLVIAEKDLQALSDLLGNKDYFLINKLTTMDVTAYAYLAELIFPQINTDFNILARKFSNLNTFAARIREEYYGNLEF